MTDPRIPDLQSDLQSDVQPGAGMPRWVPILIGLVLVVIAGFAIYTGIQYRGGDALTTSTRRDAGPGSVAPPGELDAGASRVMHGRDGDQTPAANEPVQGQARAVITGGPGGVQSTVRIWARRGMMLDVKPDDAMVYVNDVLIGEVRQFNTMDEAYDFAAPGSYTVRVVSPDGTQKTYVVTTSDEAKQDVARISTEM